MPLRSRPLPTADVCYPVAQWGVSFPAVTLRAEPALADPDRTHDLAVALPDSSVEVARLANELICD